jgi:DNA-binding HxlR family transcriptional regulator
MAGQRFYDDPCGIARALDLLGERWALLVVRELVFGAKRFTHLRRDLPGAGPNVISQRLAQLTEAGIVAQRRLDPPASATVYELTERGAAIEPILLELGRWGSRTPITSRARMSPSAFLLALKTTFRGGADARYELRFGEERFTLTVRDDTLDVRAGAAAAADAQLAADVAIFLGFVFGGMSLPAAEQAGLQVSGSRRAAARFPKLFAAPSTVD